MVSPIYFDSNMTNNKSKR